MNRFAVFVTVLVSMCAVLPAGEIHESLLEKAGIHEQFLQYARLVEGNAAAVKERLDDTQWADFSARLGEILDPGRLSSRVLEALELSLDQAQAETVITWLESEAGRKVSRLEAEAAQPQSMSELVEQAEKLMADEARTAQAVHLDRALRGTDNTIDMMLETQAVALRTSGLDLAEVEEKINEINVQVSSMRPVIASQVQLGYLYTFKSLPDADLQRYLDFAQSETGARFFDALSRGMREAIVEASGKIGELLQAFP